jgi:hypothetical protein
VVLLGTFAALVGLLALAWGVITEFQQSRARGPIAQVPTLPFAIGSALLVTLALLVLRALHAMPWWTYIAAFMGQCVIGVGTTVLAGRAGASRRW